MTSTTLLALLLAPVTLGSDAPPDLRYWKPQAITAFNDCVRAATATHLPIGTIRQRCLLDVRQRLGDPCQTPDSNLCLSFDYRDSSCGKADAEAHGHDASWVCYEHARRWYSAVTGRPDVAPKTSLLPEDHAGLANTANVLRVAPPPNWRQTAYRPPPSPGALSPLALPGLSHEFMYGLNGDRVASCEEYAWETHAGYARLADRAGVRPDAPRMFVDALLYPTVTTGLTNRAGRRLPPVEWTWFGGKPAESGPAVAQNVYVYLSDLAARSGDRAPHAYPTATFEALLRPTATHVIDLAWHRRMADAAKRAGHDDATLEELRARQERLWSLFVEYLARRRPRVERCRVGNDITLCDQEPRIDPQLDLLWTKIRSGLKAGVRDGCFPATPGQITPCDWAPSHLRDAFVHTYGRSQAWAEEQCRAKIAGEVEKEALKKRFRQIDMTRLDGTGVCPPPPPAGTVDYRQIDYTESPARLDQFRPALDAHERALLDCVRRSRDWLLSNKPLGRSSESQVVEGNPNVGRGKYALEKRTCAADPMSQFLAPNPAQGAVWDMWSSGQVSGSLLKALEADPAIVQKPQDEWPEGFRHDQVDSNGNRSPGCYGFGCMAVTGSVAIKSHVVYEPGQRLDGESSVNISVGVSYALTFDFPPIPLGWFSIIITAGFTGSAGVSGGRDYRSVINLDPAVISTEASQNTESWTIGANASTGFNLSGSVALGTPLLNIQAGIRGSIAVYDWSVSHEDWTVTSKVPGSEGPSCEEGSATTTTEGSLRGSLSLFLEVVADLGIFSVSETLFELVIATFHGSETTTITNGEGRTLKNTCSSAVFDWLLGGCHLPSGCSTTISCVPGEVCQPIAANADCP